MRLQETRNKLRAELQTIGTFNMQDKRTNGMADAGDSWVSLSAPQAEALEIWDFEKRLG